MHVLTCGGYLIGAADRILKIRCLYKVKGGDSSRTGYVVVLVATFARSLQHRERRNTFCRGAAEFSLRDAGHPTLGATSSREPCKPPIDCAAIDRTASNEINAARLILLCNLRANGYKLHQPSRATDTGPIVQ